MIIEDTNRIKMGDFIFIWSESYVECHYIDVYIVISKRICQIDVVGISDVFLFEILQTSKPLLCDHKNNNGYVSVMCGLSYSNYKNIEPSMRRFYRHDNITLNKKDIDWYMLDNCLNME